MVERRRQRLRNALSGAIGWLGDNALNAAAYLSLLVASPVRANVWVRSIASFYPTINSVGEAEGLNGRLGRRGTCLSRSLAVAARCPGSHVVFGLVPPGEGRPTFAARRAVEAHAWVEIAGVPLKERDGVRPWVEIGRLA